MTLTTNPESYTQLLVKYQPKIIETEAENDRALTIAQELEHNTNRTPSEDAILELLVTLIEKFEDEQYSIPQGTPHSVVLHLIEAGSIEIEDLVDVIGSRDVVLDIINGKCRINETQAKTFSKFFSVDVSLFLENS